MNGRWFWRPPEPPAGHSHRLPSWLIGSILVVGLGLLAGIVIVAQQAIATNDRLAALEQYVAGKGEQRDAENTRQTERINQAVCNVLDQLPAGGRLDAVRERYDCGPGLPASSPAPSSPPASESPPAAETTVPPTAEQQTGDRDDSTTPRSTSSSTAPSGTAPGASASTPVTAPTAPPPASPAPTASPVPTGAPPPVPIPGPDRGPVTDLVCGLLPPLCPM